MDRLTSLTVFGRVVESGGFSAAARKLNMSVTMVSNHIQSLEDRLGVRLLNRTTRKVSLTEIGSSYYERSRQILLDLEDADRIAEALHTTPRGTLRLHSSMAMMRFLTPIVGEYLAKYPEVSVELISGERMVDLVEEGIDLAVRAQPLADSSLMVRKLTNWRHTLCCAPSYLEKHTTPTRPADLADHNCLRYAFYPYGSDWRFDAPDGSVVSATVSGNLVTNNGEAMRTMALSGAGLMLAPSFLGAEDMEAGRLIPVMTDYRPVEFTINAIYPNRHHVANKVRAFLDLAAERIVDQRKWLNPDPSQP